MENGARPAAGGHWLASAPPNIRHRMLQNIMKILPQVTDLHGIASRYEAMVFSQSNSLQDYLRRISMKMTCFQQKKWQPAGRAASDHQQQAHMGHQMQPLNAVLANSSIPAMPRSASTLPLTGRPQQVQNLHFKVNQAHPSFTNPAAPPKWHHAPRNTTSITQVAPVVQLHPNHPTVVTQVQTRCPAAQPRPQLTRMNQQQDLRHSYHTHGGGQQSNVATVQIGYHQGHNREQFRHPQVQNDQQYAVQVEWREEMSQKITSLKDAHLSELMEFERAVRARLPQSKTNEQLWSLPKEEADQYKKAVNIVARIRCVSDFLQLQKSSIPELAKNQLDKFQTSLYSLLQFYRASKVRIARTNAGLQLQNCHELPQVVNFNGATDNSQQKYEEQPSAEALPQTPQNVPAVSPLAQQQFHSDHLAGEAETGEVHLVAEAPVAINLTPVTSDMSAFASGTCSQQMQQEHSADEAISQLTQDVDPAETSLAQLQQTHSAHSERVEAEDDSVKAEAEAETPVAAQAAKMAALRRLASDMGVNLKRAFRHTTMGSMDGSSYKRQKTHNGSLPDEIRAACSMLVETDISISEDNTGGANGTVIELCYNAVSLPPALRAAIGASEILTKLLVPTDYPESSPVIHGDRETRGGLPGVVDMAFRRSLCLLPEPRSIEGMARLWDSITRRAVVKFAQRLGGETFSSRYSHWERCIPV